MSNPRNNDRLLHIATLGRTVGLHGDMKLHLFTDFPEQFRPGTTFYTKDRKPLTLAEIRPDKSVVRLEGVTTPEAAKRFTNTKLYTTYGRTREECRLDEGQYFWFDLVGSRVEEAGETLGKILEIERIGHLDYFVVKTDETLLKQGLPKQFLLPYEPHFIVAVDTKSHIVHVRGARDILEAS